MTNGRNLELDNIPSTQFRSQNKINFYVFITCDNSLATAQLTGWKPTAATRRYSVFTGIKEWTWPAIPGVPRQVFMASGRRK